MRWILSLFRAKPAAQNCETCVFNVGGGCRRFPPQRVYSPGVVDSTVFPVVANADGWWCGEYRRK